MKRTFAAMLAAVMLVGMLPAGAAKDLSADPIPAEQTTQTPAVSPTLPAASAEATDAPLPPEETSAPPALESEPSLLTTAEGNPALSRRAAAEGMDC